MAICKLDKRLFGRASVVEPDIPVANQKHCRTTEADIFRADNGYVLKRPYPAHVTVCPHPSIALSRLQHTGYTFKCSHGRLWRSSQSDTSASVSYPCLHTAFVLVLSIQQATSSTNATTRLEEYAPCVHLQAIF